MGPKAPGMERDGNSLHLVSYPTGVRKKNSTLFKISQVPKKRKNQTQDIDHKAPNIWALLIEIFMNKKNPNGANKTAGPTLSPKKKSLVAILSIAHEKTRRNA